MAVGVLVSEVVEVDAEPSGGAGERQSLACVGGDSNYRKREQIDVVLASLKSFMRHTARPLVVPTRVGYTQDPRSDSTHRDGLACRA